MVENSFFLSTSRIEVGLSSPEFCVKFICNFPCLFFYYKQKCLWITYPHFFMSTAELQEGKIIRFLMRGFLSPSKLSTLVDWENYLTLRSSPNGYMWFFKLMNLLRKWPTCTIHDVLLVDVGSLLFTCEEFYESRLDTVTKEPLRLGTSALNCLLWTRCDIASLHKSTHCNNKMLVVSCSVHVNIFHLKI